MSIHFGRLVGKRLQHAPIVITSHDIRVQECEQLCFSSQSFKISFIYPST